MKEQVNQAISSILSRQPDNVLRTGKSFSFNSLRDQFLELHRAVSVLDSQPDFWRTLSSGYDTELGNYLIKASKYIDRMANFDPKMSAANIPGELQSIFTGFTEGYDNLFPALVVPLGAYQGARPNHDTDLTKVLEDAEGLVRELAKKNEAADGIVEALRTASAKAGVSKFAEVFGKEAGLNKKAAKRWLVTIIVYGSVLGGTLLALLLQFMAELNSMSVVGYLQVQAFLSKVVLLSVFSIGFFQVLKFYRAEKHLQTLNQHRSNCLQTFQAFVEGTDDDPTKDAVLLQAARAIFEAGDTGYVPARGVKATETFNFIERLVNPGE